MNDKEILNVIQRVLFDTIDLMNSGEVDDIAITSLPELPFNTLLEFLDEQCRKLVIIEKQLEERVNNG